MIIIYQGKFLLKYVSLLRFQRFGSIAVEMNRKFNVTRVVAIAVQLNIAKNKMNECINSSYIEYKYMLNFLLTQQIIDEELFTKFKELFIYIVF